LHRNVEYNFEFDIVSDAPPAPQAPAAPKKEEAKPESEEA
jgi:large subunit ribosomal protein L9